MKDAHRTMRQIFTHFDRNRQGHFDMNNFTMAMEDLRFNIRPEEIFLLFCEINKSGNGFASFGEFKTFVMDPSHKVFWTVFLERVERQVRTQGLLLSELKQVFTTAYRQLLLWNTPEVVMSTVQCSWRVFVHGLKVLFANDNDVLCMLDYARLLHRFDTNGNGIIDLNVFHNAIMNPHSSYSSRHQFVSKPLKMETYKTHQETGPQRFLPVRQDHTELMERGNAMMKLDALEHKAIWKKASDKNRMKSSSSPERNVGFERLYQRELRILNQDMFLEKKKTQVPKRLGKKEKRTLSKTRLEDVLHRLSHPRKSREKQKYSDSKYAGDVVLI